MHRTTVRIGASYQKTLRELALRDGKSMQAIVEQAIESYRRQRFLEGLSQVLKHYKIIQWFDK